VPAFTIFLIRTPAACMLDGGTFLTRGRMNSFKDLGLNPIINISLEALNFTEPTPIQAQTIPLALAGKDILGSAQTGTGKTLAFAIPLVSKLLDNPTDMALVLVPTRELAQQVLTAIKQVAGKNRSLKAALLIGGDSFFKQLQQLRSDARIIVGTPGRVIDHLKRNTLKPELFHFLVLDETDRMFDMGFESQIDQIIKQLPQERQTLMFSATLPASIIKTASRYLIQPERVSVGDNSSPVAKIKQDVLFVSESEKESKLIEELEKYSESIVIFVKTKWNADKLADKLSSLDHKAVALHGDLRQNRRERVIASFRKGTHNILVATDIAARGLDIPAIRHIVNYDLPQCPEDYIHRIGRTGRAGAEGFALSLVTPKETKSWKIINRFANTTEGITDSDRASLSHKPSRGGSRGGSGFGGGARRDSRDGGSRGGSGRREFSGSRDRFSDRPRTDRPSFKRDFSDNDGAASSEGGFERKPRFERSFTPRSSEDGGFERKPRFDRPFTPRSSEDGGFKPRFDRSASSDRPSFRKDRPFTPRSSEDGGFERKPRFERSASSGFPSDRPRREFTPRDGDAPRRAPFDRSSSERTGGSFFKRDGDRPFTPRSSSSEGGFKPRFDRPARSFDSSAPRSEGFKPRGDRPPFDPEFKRKKRD
jgi:ATP-dependent RNA helicase DeaD